MDEIARLKIENHLSEEFLKSTDKEEILLIENAKSDPESFGKLYDKYYDQIYRFCLHRTANIDVAQDITSEVFTKVLKKLWMFRWKNVAFSAWLFKIANNEINSFYRKNKHSFVDIDDYSEKIPDEDKVADFNLNAEEKELSEKKTFLSLHNSIKKLDLKYQEVIVLKYFEDKQIKEISEILGKSEGTVKSLLHRGIKNLKKLINPSILEEL